MIIKLTLFNPLQQEINQKITINFNNVNYYQPSGSFPYTIVKFNNGEEILVFETIEEIDNKLQAK